MNLSASYFLKSPEENSSARSHAEFGGEVGAQESRLKTKSEESMKVLFRVASTIQECFSVWKVTKVMVRILKRRLSVGKPPFGC